MNVHQPIHFDCNMSGNVIFANGKVGDMPMPIFTIDAVSNNCRKQNQKQQWVPIQ